MKVSSATVVTCWSASEVVLAPAVAPIDDAMLFDIVFLIEEFRRGTGVIKDIEEAVVR